MENKTNCLLICNMSGARCISVLSSFVRLKNEIGFSREDAEPYIQSYMSRCLGKDQKTFRVQDTSKEGECVRYLASRCLMKYLTAKLKK